MRRLPVALVIITLAYGCGDSDSRRKRGSSAVTTSTLTRPADPVVLKGSQLPPSILGIDPTDLVAFRWMTDWVQIPVQVDERNTLNLLDVYGGLFPGTVLVKEFTDPGTFTGPDSDLTLDADDEIVFMARDAGDLALQATEPSGVAPGTGVVVEIRDPLDDGIGWVYLFVHDGSLDPGAGQSYVDYSFDLLSGDYKTTYSVLAGPNPEDTEVLTSSYRRHFADRWITDELNIWAGSATGVDILDRHKNLFAPGNCTRSEDTFSDGEGAFVINKSGPVRAIRSYIGANSGPLSQREHLFYEHREDVVSLLRVHPINGIMDFYDYSPEATGMTYFSEQEVGGLPIDGVPETVATDRPNWELVTGAQGSLTHVSILEASFALTGLTMYYLDDAAPSVTQCTGDALAYGQSGYWLFMPIPNTDPLMGVAEDLTARRIIYYDAPDLPILDADRRRDWASQPLTVKAEPWP